MEDLYREHILDHYGNPRNYGLLENPDISCQDDNPLCGDVVRIDVKLDGEGRASQVGWEGEGCVISQASASMLSEVIQGKTVEELRAITQEDVLEMLGVELGPARVKCALLPLQVLEAGLRGH